MKENLIKLARIIALQKDYKDNFGILAEIAQRINN